MKQSPLLLWQHRLLFLILFLLPANLAKHFSLDSSYVNGILVDYLIPTLYLTDILIIILLILWLISLLHENQQMGILSHGRTFRSPPVIFLLLLLPSFLSASSLIPSIYKYGKLIEFSLLSLWISQHFNSKHLSRLISTLTLSLVFQSLLALGQWLNQGSLFSYWFLGEQPYHSATPGIDHITWFDGSLKIPPLGTFPHPNVLGGFLAVILPFSLYQFLSLRQLPYLFSFTLTLLSLFLTFSLSAWLAFLLIGFSFTLLLLQPQTSKFQQLPLIKSFPRFQFKSTTLWRLLPICSGIFLIILSLSSQFSFLAPTSSFSRRSQLTHIAISIIKDHPLIGIGLNQFPLIMENYGQITDITTRFLQPVHNIYLLILTETGLLGLIGFLLLLFSPIINLFRSQKISASSLLLLISYLTLLFLGLFDHYPLTIQQGLLLLFILLGLLNSTYLSPTDSSE